MFLRLDNLIGFARVYRSIAAGPLENEPQWSTNLRHKLGTELDEHRQGFQNYPLSDLLPGIL